MRKSNVIYLGPSVALNVTPWEYLMVTGSHASLHHCTTEPFLSTQGRIQDLIRGGAQIVTGLKLPFWGLSFVEFWCWGLIFGSAPATTTNSLMKPFCQS